jgi:hypothetical protein
MTDGSITVRGTGVVRAQPDEAELTFLITALAARPDEALDDVAARSATLQDVLGETGVARPQRRTSGVSIDEEREYADGRHVHRGYRATNVVTVRIGDAELIGRLIRVATERAGASVRGPLWLVAPDNPAHVEACALASADARRKADAYVGALGMRLGAITRVAEPGVAPEPRTHVRSTALMAASVEMPVEPGEQGVHAAVDVTFLLEPA